MEKKINVAELLRDCPQGMELDCSIFDNLEFDRIDKNNGTYPIICRVKTPFGGYNIHTFTEHGCYNVENYSKCAIFPKGKTTWEGFQKPFKDGDILVSSLGNPFIFKKLNEYNNAAVHCALKLYSSIIFDADNWTEIVGCRFATAEEKQKLFDAIKDNGYKWNEETKTLEKLVTIFKVGDKIKHKTYISQGAVVTEIRDTHYILDDEWALPFTFQDEYDLVPNKFDINTLKPFDKVLVRHDKDNQWKASMFSHIDKDLNSYCYKYVTTNHSYPYMIPYEGNEHLRGTTNDCDDYYKTW